MTDEEQTSGLVVAGNIFREAIQQRLDAKLPVGEIIGGMAMVQADFCVHMARALTAEGASHGTH